MAPRLATTSISWDTHTSNSASTGTITVNLQLLASTPMPSNVLLDAGQSVTYNTVLSGGAGPFTVNLIASNGLVVNTLTNMPAGTATFGPIIPTAGQQSYNVVATDTGIIIPFTFNSPTNTISVYPTPYLSLAISPSNTVPYGTGTVANASVAGGVGAFSFQWTFNGIDAANMLVGSAGSSNTLGVTAIGSYAYNVLATDQGVSTPYNLGQVSNTLTVQKASLTGSITITALTVQATGEATVSNQSAWSLYVNNVLYGTSNSNISMPIGSLSPGTYQLVFKNLGDQNYTNYTTTATLLVQQPSNPGSPGGGGGSGGAGGGGGGAEMPIVLSTKNNYVVTNIALYNTFNITSCGVKFNLTENYISATNVGMVINNVTYLLHPNLTTTINPPQNPFCAFNIKLLNVSLQPILHTVSIGVSTSSVPINMTLQEFEKEITTSNSLPTIVNLLGEQTTLNIMSSVTAEQTLSVKNLTLAQFLPPMPTGYKSQLIQNISVSSNNAAENLLLNTTVNATIKYNCSIDYYKIAPFLLTNNSWERVSTFLVKPDECDVSFTFGGDPILALASYVGSAPNTTTIPQNSTISTTTTGITPIHAPNGINSKEAIAVVAAVMIVALIVLYKRQARRAKQKQARNKKSKRASRRTSHSKANSKRKSHGMNASRRVTLYKKTASRTHKRSNNKIKKRAIRKASRPKARTRIKAKRTRRSR